MTMLYIFLQADRYTFRYELVRRCCWWYRDTWRFSLKTGEEKYYLMVTSSGKLVPLNANNLVLGSTNAKKTKFNVIYG